MISLLYKLRSNTFIIKIVDSLSISIDICIYKSLFFNFKTIFKVYCGTFLGSFDRSAVSLSNLKIILNYI